MSNEELAQKIGDFLPWWEKDDDNFYEQTLNILNSNNKYDLMCMRDYFNAYYSDEDICITAYNIVIEINKRLGAIK